jgi:hypothetical protein
MGLETNSESRRTISLGNRQSWEEGASSVTRRSDKSEKNQHGALDRPATFHDQTWEVRITRAREARDAAQALRKGKPSTFPRHLSQP